MKPNFAHAPLVRAEALPLAAGKVRWSGASGASKVYEALQKYADRPCTWEGGIRLAALLTDRPGEDVFSQQLRTALTLQAEDGSWPLSFRDAAAASRACLALSVLTGDLALLRAAGSWLSWFGARFEQLLEENAAHMADVWELIEDYYRLTDRKAALKLMELLRGGAMDWTTALHTFSMQQEMAKTVSFADLQQGMAGEDEAKRGHLRRVSALCHAETLADGMRAALLQGRFSGNAMELSAGRTGWEKISRWHGAVCGGTTADEYLAGRSPAKGISVGSVGAWAEAFALFSAEKDGGWAAAEMEKLLRNAMPAAVNGLQRVNSAQKKDDSDCYALVSDEAHQLARLARGLACAAQSCVMLRPDGVLVSVLQPGVYRVQLGEHAAAIRISHGKDADETLLELAVKDMAEGGLSICVPIWAENGEMSVDGGDAQPLQPGGTALVRRTWSGKTLIRLRLKPALRASEGYHQSVSVYRGPVLMTLPVNDETWNLAACGEPEEGEDGTVLLPVRTVPAWKKPQELPVRPLAEGEIRMAEMKPYAACRNGIAAIPRERGV